VGEPDVGHLRVGVCRPAHLSLVHDVRCQLTARLHAARPEPAVDWETVHLGAGIHDIGNIRYPSELKEPGREHEATGRDIASALRQERWLVWMTLDDILNQPERGRL